MMMTKILGLSLWDEILLWIVNLNQEISLCLHGMTHALLLLRFRTVRCGIIALSTQNRVVKRPRALWDGIPLLVPEPSCTISQGESLLFISVIKLLNPSHGPRRIIVDENDFSCHAMTSEYQASTSVLIAYGQGETVDQH
jgi:hypothetical protein